MKEYECDWDGFPGDTIKERTEGLYSFLYTVLADIGKENAFLIGSPETSAIFDTGCMGFTAIPVDYDWSVIASLTECGNQRGRPFRLYRSDNVKMDEMWMFGKNDVALVRLKNFVI